MKNLHSLTVSIAPPAIDGVHGKVAVLERRVNHLKRKLDNDAYSTTHSAEFDRAEIEALLSAVRALEFVHTCRTEP